MSSFRYLRTGCRYGDFVGLESLAGLVCVAGLACLTGLTGRWYFLSWKDLRGGSSSLETDEY